MENNVCSLETAKKLKATGFPRATAFCYVDEWDGPQFTKALDLEGYWPAPTAQEIADQFGEHHIEVTKLGGYLEAIWYHHDDDGVNDVTKNLHTNADTMAEALAALWLKLNQPDQEEK